MMVSHAGVPAFLRDGAWPAAGRGWGWGRGHGHAPGGTRTDSRLFAIERTRTSDVQLQVRTDDGDTVTLTVHAESDALALSYRSRTRGEDGASRTAVRMAGVETTREVSIEVQGSLDEEERAAIGALATRVQRAVESFFAGGAPIASALEGVEADPAMEPLAGFQLDVSRSQTLDVMMMRMREWTRGLAAAPEPVEAPVEGTPSDLTGTRAVPIGRREPDPAA